MKTHGIKYIGSKKTIIPFIIELVRMQGLVVNSAIDVFTGTTRVAQAFRRQGWKVTTSDMNWASESYSQTFICNGDNRHLGDYIDELNALEPVEGWITQNYCDVKSANGKNVVRTWQRKNGMKADAIRERIETYTHLDPWEKHTLITSLIFGLDKVDNTVGVQQAYLKNWCTRSHNDLNLELPPLLWNPNSITIEPIPPKGDHINGDCLINDYKESDLAYLDPPYSPHSYATYYHIWDSIVAWDKPKVELGTNRREDRVGKDIAMKSPWNSKSTAIGAFSDLIDRLPVKYLIISYNDESIVPKKDLVDLCNSKDKSGQAHYTEFDYKRNVMATIGNAQLYNSNNFKTDNKEILILIRK